MDTIEELKFALKQKNDELASITVNIFTLNPRISELLNEIDDLKTKIEKVEKEKTNNG